MALRLTLALTLLGNLLFGGGAAVTDGLLLAGGAGFISLAGDAGVILLSGAS